MNKLQLAGWIGLAGAILCGTGEFLLHFDSHRLGLGETGFDFMINTSEGRLNAGHFFAVVGVPLYFAGVWHIAEMIKPAGEKMSCISGVSNDMGRMAARSGLGAVMGSKRLKAVVLLMELSLK